MTKTKNAAASTPEKAQGQAAVPTQSDDPAAQASPVDAKMLAAEAQAARLKAEQQETKRKALKSKQSQETAGVEKATTLDPLEELVKRYAKCYPKCKEFHVTSDRQVFLGGDKSLALLHQATLQDEEKVQTIKVK